VKKLILLFLAIGVSDSATAVDCQSGVYTGAANSVVLYDRMNEQAADELHYLLVDGRGGTVGDDGIIQCQSGTMVTVDNDQLQKLELRETDTRFPSSELDLAGRLIEPAQEAADRPLVVLVHGSEKTATIGASPYPYILAAQGIAAFAFDKRGTGSSDGHYTQDFQALASDVAAASREAKRLAQGRFARFGLFGSSHGGWIAPLAAKPGGAGFLVVAFGLVLTPMEEDAEQVYDEMRRMGYPEAEIAKARDVTDATGVIVASRFTAGFDKLEAVKQKYSDSPWLREIEGEFTGAVLRASESDLRSGTSGDFEDLDMPWRHDALAVLQTLGVPQLWVIADEDTVAPGMLTRRRLASLQSDGLPITTALFPDTEHGMLEFIEETDGSRRYTHITEGYFRLVADYMKEKYEPPYGRAEIMRPEVAAIR